MKYPKLYSKRSDNNESLQEWTIEVEGAKYRTISGMVDGAKVTSEWTTVEQKNVGRSNETSLEAQAKAEAQAKWQKKFDAGYRETVGELSSVDLFEPMLAKNFNDYVDKIKYPVYSQRKYNGIRTVARSNGLWSRKGKKFVSMPHIEKALEGIFKRHSNLIIDGEAYASHLDQDFEKICSIVKRDKLSKEDIETSKQIKYHVYDCYIDDVFSKRIEFISKELKNIPEVVIAETSLVTNKEELDVLYMKYLEDGYEGQIVRDDSKYQNKRTKSLLKRKEFKDAEYTITGVCEGVGNRANKVGYFEVRGDKGEEFKSNIKGNMEYLTSLWKDKDNLIGKICTVKYFQLTKAGIPLFPFIIGIRDYE